jgi:hypothetical protein
MERDSHTPDLNLTTRLPEMRRAMEQISRDPETDRDTRAEAKRLVRAIDEIEENG